MTTRSSIGVPLPDSPHAAQERVTVRLPAALIQRLDEHAARLSCPGLRVTRSEAIRALLETALSSIPLSDAV